MGDVMLRVCGSGVGHQQHSELPTELAEKDLILALKTHFLTPEMGF